MKAPSSHHDTVLAAQGLVKRFGGITATDNVTLNLKKGARHALIGPNGAGKTTLFEMLSGSNAPSSATSSPDSMRRLTSSRTSAKSVSRSLRLSGVASSASSWLRSARISVSARLRSVCASASRFRRCSSFRCTLARSSRYC